MISDHEQKSSDSVFTGQESNNGISFCLLFNSEKIPYSRWNDFINTSEARAQWLLLKELLDNGETEQREDSIFLPNETMFSLPIDDLRLLNFPEYYPYNITIESGGRTLNQDEFSYTITFCDFDDNAIFVEKTGGILNISSKRKYLLTREQFALIEAIESFNNLPKGEKRYNDNLLRFYEIKELARETGSFLDAYLNNTEVVSPKRIRLKLNRIGNMLEIAPELENVNDLDNTKFLERFDLHPQSQDIYTLQNKDDSRTRIVLNNRQKEALTEIKRRRRISRQEAEKLLNAPQDYFDPEVVDLDLSFSKRVKEIGFYKPRTYPFVFPYQSKWLPGVIVQDSEGGQIKIEIKSEDDLREIEQLINKADQENSETVRWKGDDIPINDIKKQLPFFKKQIKNPYHPSKSENDEGKEPVLIIEEHIEDTGSNKVNIPSNDDFKHRYESPPNLRPEIERIYPHQEEGIAWLQELYRKGHAGGLLADDMGLGKTLQILSFLSWHDKYRNGQREPKKPYLIIAPVTLLENWEAEYHRFFNPQLHLTTLYGDNLKHYKIKDVNYPIPDILGAEFIPKVRERRGALDLERLKTADIVLTTFETVRDFQVDLGQIDWAVVVADEAQKIKTPGALVTNAIKALKTGFRIASTGTPVENSLVDLWCISDFVVPGYLGSAKEFAKEYQSPLQNRVTDTGEIGKKIREKIGIYLKRRLKKDILNDLPEKHINSEQTPMPESQLQRYMEEVKAIQETSTVNAKVQKACILQSIRALKNISDHPFLPINKEVDMESFISQSAKLIKTIEILEGIQKNGEKAVIFSESKDTCRMLKQVICHKFTLPSEEVYIVNGDMPGSKQRDEKMKVSRQTAINRFEEKAGFNVIIMSPLSAGFGLNITKANHVVHYTRWWNPAKEDQATDRVYRIGQNLPVHVYFPIATTPGFKTFDIILHELLERKRLIMSDTLFPTEQAEIAPEEIFEDIIKERPTTDGSKRRPITIEDIPSIDPFTFEAVVASIFQELGYAVRLTPEQNDKGVDVIVIPKNEDQEGKLIQVKKTSEGKSIGPDAVKEVFTAKKFFEKKFDNKFGCAVISNSDYTENAKELASANNVDLKGSEWLKKSLKKPPIYWSTVSILLLRRMDKI